MPKLHVQALIEGIQFRHFGGVVGSGRGGVRGGCVDSSDSAPGPCAEKCPHVALCAQGQACAQFAMFIRFGGNKRWRPAPRVPSREIFAVLFQV